MDIVRLLFTIVITPVQLLLLPHIDLFHMQEEYVGREVTSPNVAIPALYIPIHIIGGVNITHLHTQVVFVVEVHQ